MPEDDQNQTDESRESTDRGYEVRDTNTFVVMMAALAFLTLDTNTFVVMMAALAFLTLCGAALLVSAFLFDFWESKPSSSEPLQGATAEERPLPPGPRLQVSPPSDLAEFRASEDAILDEYGWIKRDVGVVHIPIDRAIDLVAERGLPTADPSSGPAQGH
jgi:hypothetical protein